MIHKSRCVLRLMPAVGIFALMALIVSAGFSAGFRHRIPPNEWGRFVFALSSVLTANEYGLAGFVSYEPVEAALRAGGLTNNANILSDLGTTFPENLYDPHLIESAMARASRLDLPIPALEFQNEAFNVRPAAGEDLGLIALATIAFKLISPSIKGIYFGYLFLLGTSVLLFWCAFNSDRSYTSVLLLMCAVMYVLFVSPLFPGNPKTLGSGAAWTTPLSGHFLSTLALVPALHIMAVNCRGSKASAGQMLCLGGQALILYMAFRMRLSSVWVLGPICCAAIFFFMQRKKAPSSSSLEMTPKTLHFGAARVRVGCKLFPPLPWRTISGAGGRVLAVIARSSYCDRHTQHLSVTTSSALSQWKQPYAPRFLD